MGTSFEEGVFKTILESIHVLVVDASEESGASIEQLLALHGATVTHVASPEEAAAAIEATPPDVIVADDGGLDVVRRVRERESTDERPIPVIALSTPGSDEASETLAKAGCHAVLCKPFDPEKLITLVAASVGRC